MKKRVLLIDDDPVVTAAYRNLLRAKQFEVETASNGDAGYQAVLHFKPEVILLDLDMPIANGIHFLRRIRRVPHLRSIPIIVFTASGLRNRVLGAVEAGATRVLYKVRERPHHVLDAIGNTALCPNTP
ncbi:MAG TPA: response regulator [Nevskiaceae bacterium]|nr:response regulator [Nevskiaceae bacterium]